MSRRRSQFVLAVLLVGTVVAVRAPAQEEDPTQPISRWALDLRATYTRLKAHPELETLGTVTASRGFGGGAGLHLYPLRTKHVTIGVGAELLASSGSRTPGADEFPGPSVSTTFRSLAPQLSVNFGNRQGWSYISGGIGQSSYYVQADTVALVNGPDARLKTYNYGAGARWFWNDHLAFCVDVRFYSIAANPAVETLLGTPHTRLLVISSGFSLH